MTLSPAMGFPSDGMKAGALSKTGAVAPVSPKGTVRADSRERRFEGLPFMSFDLFMATSGLLRTSNRRDLA
jgi:hypothetical protein